MFFFDIILTLYLQLALVTGEEAALGVIAVSCLGIIGGGWWVSNYIVDSLMNAHPADSGRSRSPRHKFAMISDDKLSVAIKNNSRDPHVLREYIRRNRANLPPAEIAVQIEALLAMKPSLDLEDLAMLHHQLADLYCGPLGQQLRATQVLAAFADAHPDSREAQFMRDRIKFIGTMDAN